MMDIRSKTFRQLSLNVSPADGNALLPDSVYSFAQDYNAATSAFFSVFLRTQATVLRRIEMTLTNVQSGKVTFIIYNLGSTSNFTWILDNDAKLSTFDYEVSMDGTSDGNALNLSNFVGTINFTIVT